MCVLASAEPSDSGISADSNDLMHCRERRRGDGNGRGQSCCAVIFALPPSPSKHRCLLGQHARPGGDVEFGAGPTLLTSLAGLAVVDAAWSPCGRCLRMRWLTLSYEASLLMQVKMIARERSAGWLAFRRRWACQAALPPRRSRPGQFRRRCSPRSQLWPTTLLTAWLMVQPADQVHILLASVRSCAAVPCLPCHVRPRL